MICLFRFSATTILYVFLVNINKKCFNFINCVPTVKKKAKSGHETINTDLDAIESIKGMRAMKRKYSFH
jgi:hypothetical protein